MVKRWAKRGFSRSEVMREGAQNIRFHLTYIGYLYQQRKWLAGDEMTLADITAAAHLSVLDYMGDVPWDTAAGARDWYAKVKSRPSLPPVLMDGLVGLKRRAHYDDPDFGGPLRQESCAYAGMTPGRTVPPVAAATARPQRQLLPRR